MNLVAIEEEQVISFLLQAVRNYRKNVEDFKVLLAGKEKEIEELKKTNTTPEQT